MKNKTLLIVAVLFVLSLGLTLGIGSFKKSNSPALPSNAALSLESDKNSVNPGQEFTVTMTLDSGKTEVAAADFVLQYDPKYLKVVSVSTGKFFTNYPINTQAGNYVKISGVASFDGETLVLPRGKDTVGKIVFRALQNAGKTTVKFDSSKTIVATNGQNILNKKKLASLTLNVQ